MNDRDMLELILGEIRDMKTTQETLVQKVDGITEQLGKVSELETVVQKLVKDVARLETDVAVIKKAIAN